MNVQTGRFADPQHHHAGWFRMFRGRRIVEVWFGHRWLVVSL